MNRRGVIKKKKIFKPNKVGNPTRPGIGISICRRAAEILFDGQ